MSARITIILCALAGLACLGLFFQRRGQPEVRNSAPPPPPPARTAPLLLDTAPLGELSLSAGGLLAGNSRGEVLFFPAGAGAAAPVVRKLSDSAITAPVLEQHGVYYVGDESGVFRACSTAGQVLWSYATGSRITGGALYSRGTVFVGSYDQVLYAFEAASGKLQFKYECGDSINGTPALSETQQALYLNSCDGIFRKIALPSGELSASLDLSSPLPASPLLAGEILYVLTHQGELLALQAADLSVIYRVQTPDTYLSSPYAAGEFLFLTTADGAIQVHSRDSGERLGALETSEEMTPLQAARDGRCFALSIRGKVFAYRRQDNAWQRELLADLKSDFRQSCRLAGDILYAADSSGGLFYCRIAK
ncbi:MAG: PQQ-binding-like beta-propeller repeat protein [Oligosphaeraceae bacterium]|nr:PQQ-binding-like beta-propeller repeat protein [Oligosphaeraceae bacterium]